MGILGTLKDSRFRSKDGGAKEWTGNEEVRRVGIPDSLDKGWKWGRS